MIKQLRKLFVPAVVALSMVGASSAALITASPAGAATPTRVALNRYFNGTDHVTMSGPYINVTSTYQGEGPLGEVYVSAQPGTHALYQCVAAGWDQFTTPDSRCEGFGSPQYLLGFVSNTQVAGTIPLYRCYRNSGDHLDSLDPNCEGQHYEGLLGWVIAEGTLNRFHAGNDHSATHLQGYSLEGSLGDVVVANALGGYPAGTHPIYECLLGSYTGTWAPYGNDMFTSASRDCEGYGIAAVRAMLGALYDRPTGTANIAIYRCYTPGSVNHDHFDSTDPHCEGAGQTEGVLGYALPAI